MKVKVHWRYKLHPLPHGSQRHTVLQQLRRWQWKAKPLQPIKGDAQGAAWEVGASTEPPSLAMPAGDGYVIITLLRENAAPRIHDQVCASQKTKRSILYDDNEAALSSAASQDPWAVALTPGHRPNYLSSQSRPPRPSRTRCKAALLKGRRRQAPIPSRASVSSVWKLECMNCSCRQPSLRDGFLHRLASRLPIREASLGKSSKRCAANSMTSSKSMGISASRPNWSRPRFAMLLAACNRKSPPSWRRNCLRNMSRFKPCFQKRAGPSD